MRAAVVLQCTLAILAEHVAVACQSGEVVKARWTDGVWKAATIVEVRDRPDGICGQYRLTWHHSDICEDPTINGHDTRISMNFCLVSRDAIKTCKQELCRWGRMVESEKFKSSSIGADTESNRHVAITIVVVVVSILLACCCIFLRLRSYGPHAIDVEKGMDAGTPCATGRSLKSGKSFWNFTPKSATSSPVAKWISKTREAAGPSNKDKKIIIQPEPVAAVLPAKSPNSTFQIAELKRVQPQKGTGRHDPLGPPGVLQTHGSALRHAARTYGGPHAPPSLGTPSPPPSIFPSPQLPTLLQHREGPTKLPPRRKPPLQGVPPQPPQGTRSERAKKGSSSYKQRSQAPHFV